MGTVGDLLDLVRLYWPLLLGNSLEWYEFAVYGRSAAVGLPSATLNMFLMLLKPLVKLWLL